MVWRGTKLSIQHDYTLSFPGFLFWIFIMEMIVVTFKNLSSTFFILTKSNMSFKFIFFFSILFYSLFILRTNHCSLSPPPTFPQSIPSTPQKGLGLPWGFNKAWHIQFRQDQVFHYCLHQGWARHPTIWNGFQTARSCTRDRSLTTARLQNYLPYVEEFLFQSHIGSSAVGIESMSSWNFRSTISVGFLIII